MNNPIPDIINIIATYVNVDDKLTMLRLNKSYHGIIQRHIDKIKADLLAVLRPAIIRYMNIYISHYKNINIKIDRLFLADAIDREISGCVCVDFSEDEYKKLIRPYSDKYIFDIHNNIIDIITGIKIILYCNGNAHIRSPLYVYLYLTGRKPIGIDAAKYDPDGLKYGRLIYNKVDVINELNKLVHYL